MHAVPLLAKLTLAACVLALAYTGTASAAPPPPGSKWTQGYITEADGTKLHYDLLRPANLPDSARTPVILSIGPYFNHSGELGPVGLVDNAPYDPRDTGPSDRFYDFINGAKIFQKGYSWIQFDLRGFGASTGCLDWAGPGEQADVKAAVEWTASQPWSTGKVGTYGKSYDAVTGLIAIRQQPRGLAAVIAQEPLYDLYRYLYMNRVRYLNSLATPALYDAIAGSPGGVGPSPDIVQYNVNALDDLARPGCPAFNYADQQEPNHDAAYWKPRDLIAGVRGKKTPLFLTQGLLENNTKPDGAAALYNAIAGPKRGWFGMWDHVRGNDVDTNDPNRLSMGRHGWFDEAMRFYDLHLKGQSSSTVDPPAVVETNDGKWRAETAWPPRDAFTASASLRPGTYVDHAQNSGSNEIYVDSFGLLIGDGQWTFSPRFDHEVRLSGTPRATLDLQTQAPNANVVVDVYDVGPDNRALLLSRGTHLIPQSGRYSFDLYDQDWVFPASHRLGVLVTGSNAEWWKHTPTGQTVTVKSASLTLPYLGCRRTQTVEGGPSVRLDAWKDSAPFDVDPDEINANTVAGFPVPAPLATCSKTELAGGAATARGRKCIDRRKFKFRVHQPKHGRIVRVTAYVNGKKKKVKRGTRVKSFTLRRLPKGVFKVKIVARAKNGQRTISVRKYRGCKKSRPRTRVRKPHRHR